MKILTRNSLQALDSSFKKKRTFVNFQNMFRYFLDHRQLHMVLIQFEFTTCEYVTNFGNPI